MRAFERIARKHGLAIVEDEIAAGRSFASAAKGLTRQPIASNHGVVLDYEHGGYAELPLDRAIMSARPGALEGPLGIQLGYYVFRVTHVHPSRQAPFSKVERGIPQQLPRYLRHQALNAYTASWAARWKARTSCAAGYLVSLCGEVGASPRNVSLTTAEVFE